MKSTISCYYTHLLYNAGELLRKHILPLRKKELNNKHKIDNPLVEYLEIFDKIVLLWSICNICLESTATFMQLNEKTVISLIEPIRDFCTNIFSRKLPKEEIEDYLRESAINLKKELLSSPYSYEIHKEAYKTSGNIVEKFGYYACMYYLPILCMNIDLSYTDILNCRIKNLSRMIDDNPEDFNANFRFKKLAEEGRDYLRNLEESTIKAKRRLKNGIFKSFPQSLEIYNRYGVRKFEKSNGVKCRDSLSLKFPITWHPGRKGIIGITYPAYLIDKILSSKQVSQNYAQMTLSQFLSSELVLWMFNRRRITPEILNEIRYVLEDLTKQVEQPSKMHEIVESVAKHYLKDTKNPLYNWSDGK